MHYLKFKKEKIDICNICLKEKPLSWDHVPPQGGIEVTEIEQINILQKLAITGEEIKPKFSQNGIKYRTICAECNAILGSDVDKEINKLAKDVKSIINSSLILPSVINYKTKPKKIVKSLFAHMLSAKVDNENLYVSKIDRTLRAYYLNKIEDISINLKVYYWLYPYPDFVIMRDVAMLAKRGQLNGNFGVFNILKYYPIGYLITDLDNYEQLNELTQYTTGNIDDEVEIPINLAYIKDRHWPERVDGTDYNLILGETDSLNTSVYATPKKKKPHIFNQ